METPDYMHEHARQILACELRAQERAQLWAVRLNLIPQKDGNQWCVLWGENLQVGIAAYGDTPEDAMWHFDEAMASKNGSRP